MEYTLYAICLSLALITPTPTLSYTYDRFPITTGDESSSSSSSTSSSSSSSDSQQQQQHIVPTFPSLLIPTQGPSDVAHVVDQQQQQTVGKYLSGLLQTLETYGAPEAVRETVEDAVEHVQETLENVQEAAEEMTEQVVENIQKAVEDVDETAQEIVWEAQDTLDHIQEIANERGEIVQTTAENVKETAEEQVQLVQQTLDNLHQTAAGDPAEKIQQIMNTATQAASESSEEDTDSIQQTTDQHVQQVQEILESVQDTAEEQQEQAQETLGAVGEFVEEATEQKWEQAQETLDQVREYAQDVFEHLLDAIKAKAGKDSEDSDSEDSSSSVSSSSSASTTQASHDSDEDEDEDSDSGEVVTAAPTAPTTTNMVDDDDSAEDSSDEATTTAPNTNVDNDDSSEEADVTTTTVPTTYYRTLTPSEGSDSGEDSHEVIDTTTTAPSTAVYNLCDGCEFKHGVGYNPHPSDCTLFVQCHLGDKGYPVVAGVQACPHGLYWNQQKLTCDFRRNVNCVDDVCLGFKKTKRSAASCRGYWDCASGTATAKCCARGFAYNPVTDRCNYQPQCQDDCLATSTQVSLECGNGMRGVAGDRTVYEVKTGNTWTRMPCPATLAFSTNPCGCNAPRSGQLQFNTEPVCAPELYLPFNSDARDFSGNNVHVKNEGVLVKNGKAYFDGNSRLTVNRFSSAWWGATVYVHLRYKPLSGGAGIRQALVSNGDCQARPSLAICAGSNGVEFYAETSSSALPANFTVNYGSTDGSDWKDVLYKLDDNQLQGYVNTYTSQASAKGNLETRQRALVIGSGGGCDDFEGFIDELTVYLCRPYFK